MFWFNWRDVLWRQRLHLLMNPMSCANFNIWYSQRRSPSQLILLVNASRELLTTLLNILYQITIVLTSACNQTYWISWRDIERWKTTWWRCNVESWIHTANSDKKLKYIGTICLAESQRDKVQSASWRICAATSLAEDWGVIDASCAEDWGVIDARNARNPEVPKLVPNVLH